MQTRQTVKHSLNHSGVTRAPQTGRVTILPHTPQRLEVPQSLNPNGIVASPQPPKRTAEKRVGGAGNTRTGLTKQPVHGAIIRQRHTPRRQPRRGRKRQHTPPLPTLHNHTVRHQTSKNLTATHTGPGGAGAVELHRVRVTKRHLVPRCQNDSQHHVGCRLGRPKTPRHVTHPPQTEPRSDPPKHPRGQHHPGAASQPGPHAEPRRCREASRSTAGRATESSRQA